ncbi:MAG TPA: hypothetical protein VH331_07275 [Allosphingosinicella sp.]|jgi:hypothetical protein|nr:hypothetical protein [Allosphingosinicella sp.]
MADGQRERHEFVALLELADSRGGDLDGGRGGDAPGLGLPEAPPIPFDTEQQAVAAGSQLIEFDASVSPDLRSAVTNVMLLAQLAANKAAPSGPIEAWYAKYTEVLGMLGWVTSGLSEKDDHFDGAGIDVQQAILGVLTAALGPGAAAASILAAAIGALGKTADTGGWIDLFERASRHTSFTSFQLSYGTAKDGEARLHLLCFSLDADSETERVIFFRIGAAHAQLRQYSGDIAADPAMLMQTKDVVAAKVAASAADYLSTIAI